MRRFLLAAALMPALLAPAAQAFDLGEGRQLYERYCARCHGSDGYSTMPQAPDLARGSVLIRSNSSLKKRLLAGDGLCLGLRGLVDESQLHNLTLYLRTFRR